MDMLYAIPLDSRVLWQVVIVFFMQSWKQYHSDHLWQSSLASGATACRLQHGVQVFSSARRSVPRVDDQSSFGSLYTSPHMLGRSGWPSWLWSTNLFNRWSVSVEQSAAGDQDNITDTQTVLWPA